MSGDTGEASKVSGQRKYPVLLVGFENSLEEGLGDLLAHCEVTRIPMDMDQVIDCSVEAPVFIICGMPPEDLPVTELAQGIRMTFRKEPIFLVCSERSRFDRKNFIKNGFTDGFLMPIDWAPLRYQMEEILAKVSEGRIRSFRPVKLVDIQPGTVLDFDTNILLPLNKKHVKMTTAGDSLDTRQLERLKKHKHSTIYVKTEQMDKFYEYTSKRLDELVNDSGSSSEKAAQVQVAVRELLGGVFAEASEAATFEEGRNLVQECFKIVRTYTQAKVSGNYYERLEALVKDGGDFYAHGGNVAALVALFSVALGIGKTEELAIAGVLHDIGLADVPIQVIVRTEEQRSEADWVEYRKHPEHSLRLIKARKLIIPESVMNMVQNHHERFNGTGYPRQLSGRKVNQETQLLALADLFDEMTTVKEGKARQTLDTVLAYFSDLANTADPLGPPFDPALLRRFLEVFKKSSSV
jgi:HD-GYP domain-containing protein (c-di-GMP phosphodiesterase class II)